MIKIKDEYTEDIYEFRLSDISFNQGWIYTLKSSQTEYILEFTLPYMIESIYPGKSTSVYLFKNLHYAQQDVLEIRINEYPLDGGRIGYLVHTSVLFDPSIITINKHLLSFFYYALGNLFFNEDYKQTKIPTFAKSNFVFADFFDDNLLILMLVDQNTAQIANFSINTYIPSLYKIGFYSVNPNKPHVFSNNASDINLNYQNAKANPNREGYFPVRLKNVTQEIMTEIFLQELFFNQLLRKNDQETRFLLLYQSVEILILKILTNELRKKICTAPIVLEAFKLKKAIAKESTESSRIRYLFNNYSYVDNSLKESAKASIFTCLQYLGIPEYSQPYVPANYVINNLLYDYRNRLVHNHRSFRHSGLDEEQVEIRMKSVNSLLELLIIDILTSYHH